MFVNMVGEDVLLLVCMIFLCVVALLVAINCSKGIVRTVISYFLVVMMLFITVALVASRVINHVTTVNQQKSEKEQIMQSVERERFEREALEAAKENEELKSQVSSEAAENRGTARILTDVETAIKILRDIAAINEARYAEILADSVALERFRAKSIDYHSRLQRLNSRYANKNFPAPLKAVGDEIKSGFRSAEESAVVFKGIFSDGNQAMFPGHLVPARNAIRFLGNAKRVLDR